MKYISISFHIFFESSSDLGKAHEAKDCQYMHEDSGLKRPSEFSGIKLKRSSAKVKKSNSCRCDCLTKINEEI